MKQLFFSLLLLVSSLYFVVAQTSSGVLQVYVEDERKGTPLKDAHLYVGKQVVLSDERGYASIEIDRNSSPYLLLCTYVGYDTLRISLEELPSEPLRLQMKAALLQLETVVVSSLRQHEEAPLSHTIVSKKEIEEIYLGEDAPFFLQYQTPSLLVQSQSGVPFGNYADLQLRGMDESRINLTLAGIPLSDMLDHSFYFSNFSDLAESASSIQVQRGVGSSTHGTAAYAGSINLTPPRVFGPARLGAHLVGGDFGSMKLSAEGYSGTLPNGLGAYVRVSRSRSDGYRYHSGHNAYSFFVQTAYRKKKHLLEFTSFSGQTQNELANTRVAEDSLKKDPRLNPISSNETDLTSQSLVALRHTFFAGSEQAAGYTLYFGHAANDYPYGYVDTVYKQTNYYLRNIHLGLQAHLQGRLGKGSWRVGSQGYLFLRKNQESNMPDKVSLTYEDRSRKTAFNIFAKVDQQWRDWQMFVDLQLRTVSIDLLPEERFLGEEADISLRRWLFFNPKAGLRYHLSPATSLYTSLAFSQREPTRFDIIGGYTTITTGTLPIINDTSRPRPEEVLDWELGLTSKRRYLQSDLNFFYMGFRNEITPIGEYIKEHYAQLRKNVPKSYRLGVEGKATLELGSRVQLSGLGYWMQGRISEYAPENDPEKPVFKNVRIGGAPNFQLQLQTNYQLPFWKDALSVWLRSRYQGKTYLNPIQEDRLSAPEVFLMDLGLQLRLSKYAKLGLQLRNLLDERYYSSGEVKEVEDSSGKADKKNVPSYFGQAGFNVFVSLRIEVH